MIVTQKLFDGNEMIVTHKLLASEWDICNPQIIGLL